MNGHRQAKWGAVSNDANRKNAMTLTPPFAGKSAIQSRCVWRIIASRRCKSNAVQNEFKNESNKNRNKSMSKRIDYEQIAAKLDYPALDKKLEQLAQSEPPKTRKTAADLLEPLRERLLALYHNGWSSQQIADELKAAGVPVNVARVRECLSHWTKGGKGTAKRRGNNRGKRTPPQPAPSPATNPIGRSKSASGDNQSGLKF
jgi:hypothetical protein